MCTELFLAIIYFSTIFVVNYYLYKLLDNYLSNIIYLLKLKNIFKYFSKFDSKFVFLFYYYVKNEGKAFNLLKTLRSSSNIEDSLIIGNIYKYLGTNNFKNSPNRISMKYYFQLLENQYLSRNNNLK